MSGPHRAFQVICGAIACVILTTGGGAASRDVVGYYPSWLCGSPAMPDCDPAADLSRVSQGYTHVILAFAKPDFAWDGMNWAQSGLQFHAGPADIRRAVETLHRRHIRVLLAVGGAKYLDWTVLAAENGSDGPATRSLAAAVADLGLDGLDVDYEKDGAAPDEIAEYAGAVRALHRAATLAGADNILTLAAWSTGADCTAATGLAACGGKASVWPGRAGRERLLFRDKTLFDAVSMISVMAYDAGTARFDPVTAWSLYRAIMPSRVVVNMGFEIAPEGWGDGTLVAGDAEAVCVGAIITGDQFGNNVRAPYSVERLIRKGPLARLPNANPHDGAMLWNILKSQDLPSCGDGSAVSPGEWMTKVRTLLDGRQHAESRGEASDDR